MRRPLDYERTQKVLRQWRPYRGLVYLQLLLKYLEEKALIAAGAEHRV